MILTFGTLTVRMTETPARVEMTAFLGDRQPAAPSQPFTPAPNVTSFSVPQEIVDAATLPAPIPPVSTPELRVISTTSELPSASAGAPPQQAAKPVAIGKTGTTRSAGKTPGRAGLGAGTAADARPLASRNSPPRYPEMARRNGWQGVVLVRVTVLPDGRVRNASLFRGSGYAILDQSALEAVRRWLFQPKTSAGLAVESTIEVPVTFSLRKA